MWTIFSVASSDAADNGVESERGDIDVGVKVKIEGRVIKVSRPKTEAIASGESESPAQLETEDGEIAEDKGAGTESPDIEEVSQATEERKNEKSSPSKSREKDKKKHKKDDRSRSRSKSPQRRSRKRSEKDKSDKDDRRKDRSRDRDKGKDKEKIRRHSKDRSKSKGCEYHYFFIQLGF